MNLKFYDMINKFRDYFGIDGLLHIICSTVLVSLLDLILPLIFSIIITLLIGIGKEVVWDKMLGKGTYDKKDIIADIIGILIGIL